MTVFHIVLFQIEVKIGEFRWFCLYQFVHFMKTTTRFSKGASFLSGFSQVEVNKIPDINV